MADFGQTDFGQTDFGQFGCFSVLAKFSGVVVVVLLFCVVVVLFCCVVVLCCCVVVCCCAQPQKTQTLNLAWESGPALRGHLFWVCVVVVVVVVVVAGWTSLDHLPPDPPPPLDPPPPDRPKCALFLPFSRHRSLFLCLSGCLLVEFWWCFEGGNPEMCPFGLSGCRVKKNKEKHTKNVAPPRIKRFQTTIGHRARDGQREGQPLQQHLPTSAGESRTQEPRDRGQAQCRHSGQSGTANGRGEKQGRLVSMVVFLNDESETEKTPNTASRVATRRDPVLHLRQAVCLPTMWSNLDATKNLAGRASWQLHATQLDNLLLVALQSSNSSQPTAQSEESDP